MTNEPSFYVYSILVNKCSGSYDNVNDPYAKLSVPEVVQDMNIKVFYVMSRINETRHISWHETCICKCRLAASVLMINNLVIMINADVNAKN